MPEFKKSTGYKMKGFSYPGESPLKGKKAQARKLAAKEATAAAAEKQAAFNQMQMGTGGEASGQFKVDLPPTISGTPIKDKDNTMRGKDYPEVTVVDKTKWGKAEVNTAKSLGKGFIEASIKLGGSAIGAQKRKKRKNKIGPKTSKFSKIKFGKKADKSPVKLTDKERQANLLRAVPNKQAYDKLSDVDKEGFIEYAKKIGLPTKKEKKT